MMHIPEKYRDRYDRLALAHPWMREMRDEPCTSEGEKVQGLPDNSVLYLLRDVAKKSDGHTLYHGATKLMQAIGKEPEDRRETGSELAIALNTLADMVERDYVSREKWTEAMRAMKSAQDAMERARDERDDANEQWEQWSKLATDIIALFYPVEDEGLPNDAYSVVKDSASKLTAERDEWKRKAEQAERAMNVAAGKWARADARNAKRAAAVERLDGVEQATDENLLNAILGAPAGLNLHGAEKLITLKALLTDEEGSSKVRVGKSKSDKRAAAVERLKSIPPMDTSGIRYVRAILGSVAGMTAQDVTRELIDLLTDNDANDDSTPENDVSATDVDANDANATCNNSGENVTHDSREKLEADIDAFVLCVENEAKSYVPSLNGYGTREKLEDLARGLKRRMLEVADRQESITERECREYEDAMREQHHKRVAILRANLEDAEFERDELQSKLDDDWRCVSLKKTVDILKGKVVELKSENAALMDAHADDVERLDAMGEGKLMRQVDELKAERNYWKQQVKLCMQSAYPPSHSPERSYDPNVMAYPDRKGCTTPSTLVADVIDGLRDKLTAVAKAVMS